MVIHASKENKARVSKYLKNIDKHLAAVYVDIKAIRKDLKVELTKNQLKAEKVTEEIVEVDIETKKTLDNATPEELEELARGLLSVSKNK